MGLSAAKTAELLEKVRVATRGNPQEIARQHQRQKLTARERIDRLTDPGSFTELDLFVRPAGGRGAGAWGDGVVTGYATIEGRPVCLYAQDFTVQGGSLGRAHAGKIAKVMDLAVENGVPLIGLIDSGGARIQEGLGHYGLIFYRNVRASGVVPQLSLILGPCAGGAVYSPALGDFILMVQGISRMFITGPQVIKAVTGEETTTEKLGGAQVQCATSGVAHFLLPDEESCFQTTRRLLAFLPANSNEMPPCKHTRDEADRRTEEIEEIVPDDQQQAYDMREVIRVLVDEGDFLEVQELYARNIICAFARLAGRPVGIIANQPKFLAGCIDINAADKAARFIRFCDAFNLPILNLVDCPGYLPGVAQEHGGIIRHGAKMIYAYAEATVPRISVVLRKVYGGAMSGMAVSKYMGTDFSLALPTAEMAIMGPEAAVNVLYRDELARAADAEGLRRQKIKEYRERFANPYVAAEEGWIDAVVAPADLRRYLINAFGLLAKKASCRPGRKHGLMPV